MFGELAEEAGRKEHKAELWLLETLFLTSVIPYEEAMNRLNLTPLATKSLLGAGVIVVEVVEKYRDPLEEVRLFMGNRKRNQAVSDDREPELWDTPPELNPFQREITDTVMGEYDRGIRRTYLLHGVTRSGRTGVYVELIAYTLSAGRQVIMLIPETSFTWQTVMRFYNRFDGQVSVTGSQASARERYDQCERIRTGDIDIIIGPRSALFAPFENLGLVIIDEEHGNVYKNELSPRYSARGVVAKRAQMNEALLVLGSATPSLESYTRVVRREYELFTLRERVREDVYLPLAEIVDLREELEEGNRSISSRHLKALIEERLEKREQVILFINRRGCANFASCCSCGEAVRYSHCDVTLTPHRDGCMTCRYYGYSVPQPKERPICGPPYVAPFGTGIRKIEAMTTELFSKARILRMDLDATSKKGGHQEILSPFVKGEADILTDTQMIVKSRDFSEVTLAGALVADSPPYVSDHKCGKQTFAPLTQATGQAGRGQLAGNVVMQTYQPGHCSIHTATTQDYESFYSQEMAYRRLLGYPSVVVLLAVQMACSAEGTLTQIADLATGWVRQWAGRIEQGKVQGYESSRFIGPINAAVYKVNDIYKKILYIKHGDYDILIRTRKTTEEGLKGLGGRDELTVQYDLA